MSTPQKLTMGEGSGQWSYHTDGFPRHVWPLDDLKPHVVDGLPCWCNPIDDDGVIRHNSMDGREDFENGKRLPS